MGRAEQGRGQNHTRADGGATTNPSTRMTEEERIDEIEHEINGIGSRHDLIDDENDGVVSVERERIPAPVYVVAWIALSSGVILFNKLILDRFAFPIFLTTVHLIFATAMTQLLARTTHLLDGLRNVKMTGRVYMRAILPIGVFFSMSLILNNNAYLYLSVAFIQMLKATTPVVVLLASWAMRQDTPNLRVLANISVVVLGVIIASYGEIAFVFIGFVFQTCGIVCEATRLVMVQRLLSGTEYKMDPLVSLYYFAPVCAVMNGMACLVFESSTISLDAIWSVGPLILLANASVAFGLNVSVVMLIGKTSSLVLTLSGVLKDILLVFASVLIWGTVVSGLQILGYAIALSGLVYYKLGGETIMNGYQALRKKGLTQMVSRVQSTRQRLALAGGTLTALVIFLLLFTHVKSGDISPQRLELPEAAAIQKGATTLDIVVSEYRDDLSMVKQAVEQIQELENIKKNPRRIMVYTKDEEANVGVIEKMLSAESVQILKSKGRESETFLAHILANWDTLSTHTLFLPAKLQQVNTIVSRIRQNFGPTTAFLPLGVSMSNCSCNTCTDPFDDQSVLLRMPQIYSAAYGQLCPDEAIPVTSHAQFLASRASIHRTSKHVYEHLRDIINADKDHWIYEDPGIPYIPSSLANPSFGKQVDRAWPLLMHCADIRLSVECSSPDSEGSCQCTEEE